MYIWHILRLANRLFLKTYPLIRECGRCRDCGRNVHDFDVPNDLWLEVIGSFGGIYCYDCFANRADEKLEYKWRARFVEQWYVK